MPQNIEEELGTMVPILDPMCTRSGLSTMDLDFLMFSQGILSRNQTGDKVKIGGNILNFTLSLLEIRGKMFLNEPIILGSLLTNGLEKHFQDGRLAFHLSNLGWSWRFTLLMPLII